MGERGAPQKMGTGDSMEWARVTSQSRKAHSQMGNGVLEASIRDGSAVKGEAQPKT